MHSLKQIILFLNNIERVMFKLLKLVLATMIAGSQENNKLLGHLHGRPQ